MRMNHRDVSSLCLLESVTAVKVSNNVYYCIILFHGYYLHYIIVSGYYLHYIIVLFCSKGKFILPLFKWFLITLLLPRYYSSLVGFKQEVDD